MPWLSQLHGCLLLNSLSVTQLNIARLIPCHMLWAASGCFAVENYFSVKLYEFCIILAGTIKIFLTRILSIIRCFVVSYQTDSLSRWPIPLVVFEFFLWYFVFKILSCGMFRYSWLNPNSSTFCKTY